MRTIDEEITGFQIEKNAKGWLQPYNNASFVTPGYEDFYFNVSPGDTISKPRNPSVGWCMPALFNVNDKKHWILIAEAGTDGSYAGCHLRPDSEGGIYKIAFPKKDEKFQLPISDETSPSPKFNLPWTMPWRVIVIGDHAGDILLSSLITDLAPASKIEDISWIEPERHRGRGGLILRICPQKYIMNSQTWLFRLAGNTRCLMLDGKKQIKRDP